MPDIIRIILLIVYIVLNVFLFICALFNHNARKWMRVLCLVAFLALNGVFIYGALNWWFL